MSSEQKSQEGSHAPSKYWAFISYSSKDKRWGQWLHRRLESYPIPKQFQGTTLFDGAVLGKNLRPVFRDRDELAGSSELGPAILRALAQTRYLVVLCSKNSAKSQWVNKEIEDFQAMSKGKSILALILDGEPNATSNKDLPDSEECFPPALRYPAEPLAGDLRKDGDGKERGFLKVIAGAAQLDFDVLYRRHERAQRRRRLTLGAIALVVMLALAGLSAFALYQQAEADKQRQFAFLRKNEAEAARSVAENSEEEARRQEKLAHENENTARQAQANAEKQTEIATRAKEEAEGLLGMVADDLAPMILDTNSPIEVKHFLEAVEDHFKTHQPTNPESIKSALTFHILKGRYARDRGLLEDSFSSLEQSSKYLEMLEKGDTPKASLAKYHARHQRQLGLTLIRAGRLHDAEEAYRTCITKTDIILGKGIASSRDLHVRWVAMIGLIKILRMQGEHQLALAECVELQGDIKKNRAYGKGGYGAHGEGSSKVHIIDIDCLRIMGGIHFDDGQYEEARKVINSARAMIGDSLSEGRASQYMLEVAGDVFSMLGMLFMHESEHNSAMLQFDRAIKLSRERTSGSSKEEIAMAVAPPSEAYVRAALAAGRLEEAERTLDEALDLACSVPEARQSEVLSSTIAAMHYSFGEIRKLQKRFLEARSHYQRFLDQASVGVKNQGARIADHRNLSIAHEKIGGIEELLNNPLEAELSFKRSLECAKETRRKFPGVLTTLVDVFYCHHNLFGHYADRGEGDLSVRHAELCRTIGAELSDLGYNFGTKESDMLKSLPKSGD